MSKEEDIILERIKAIADRQKEFDDALKARDMMRITYLFSKEQASHLADLSDAANDPELKTTLAMMGANVSFSIDEKYFSLKSDRPDE